jgi:dolichol kinase
MILSVLPPFGSPAGELVRASLVLVALGAVLAAAEVWHHLRHPPAEWTRKLAHFGIGLVTCALPWLLSSIWTLLGLAVAASAPVLWARSRGWLRSVFAVERESWGEVYFPLAVVVLFAIGRERPVFYVVSLLTMVVADALAAVLGRAYGRHQYLVTTHRRSLEGSAVFLFAAFLVVHLPLLLATGIDRAACVLVAAQIALLVASFEAIGTNGSDNLFVPLGTYYLLLKLTPRPVEAIALQLAAQVAILIVMLAVARGTGFLSFSGAIAAHLMLYAAFSLGGPGWLVAPALALTTAIVLENYRRRAVNAPFPGHDVRVIFHISIVAVALIFADNTFATLVPGRHELSRGHPFLAPYVGSLAAAIAIVASMSLETLPRVRHRSARWRALTSGVIGFGVVAPIGLWFARGNQVHIELATAALVCVVALILFRVLRRLFPRPPRMGWNLRYLALAVLGATLAVLPLHFRWIGVATWSVR